MDDYKRISEKTVLVAALVLCGLLGIGLTPKIIAVLYNWLYP